MNPDLLEDTEACAKFIDGVSKVVDSSFFVRHEAYSRKAFLLTMMHKSMALVAKYTHKEHDYTKAVREITAAMVAEACLVVEKSSYFLISR